MKLTELTLPEWAFLDAHSHEGDQLDGRTVILHVRSSSVIEVFGRGDATLNDGVVTYKFGNKRTGEKMIAVLHYSTTVDEYQELKDLLKKCAIWYVDYSDWEDHEIMDEL
jgi:hypothetical protein